MSFRARSPFPSAGPAVWLTSPVKHNAINKKKVRDDEPGLIKQILELVREYPRYGYRFIWAKLRQLGWKINKKRVHRIWKQEGLKVTVKKRKKRRLGNSNNSASRRQATGANEVWSWDFIFDRTVTGKQLSGL